MTAPRWAQKAILYATLTALVVTCLAVLWGCAPNRVPQLPPGEFVDHSDYCTEISRCRAFAAFWRPTDAVAGPVWWAVSTSGRGCQIPAEVFTLLQDGVLLRCDWRAPRPVL